MDESASEVGDSVSTVSTHTTPVAKGPISGYMEKAFIGAIKWYGRGGSINPIEWSWELIQQVHRTSPSEEAKRFAIRSRVDSNTLLQIDGMTSRDTPRPSRWYSSWEWPIVITEEEPYEIWACRRIVEAAYGDPRISRFVSLLKPSPQQKDEPTSLYQARISNSRDINAFVVRVAGHLYSVPDVATIDQYLCKEYRVGIQIRVTRAIAEMIEDQKRAYPNRAPYVPTVADYCAAALQAEEVMLDLEAMLGERTNNSPGAAVAAAVEDTPNFGNQPTSLLGLVRPFAPAPSASAPPSAQPAGAGTTPSAEGKEAKQQNNPANKLLLKAAKKLEAIFQASKNSKRRHQDSDSDSDSDSPKGYKKNKRGILALKGKYDKKGEKEDGCFNCGAKDHQIRNCPKDCRPTLTCPKCRQKGHFTKDCKNGNAKGAGNAMPRNGAQEAEAGVAAQ